MNIRNTGSDPAGLPAGNARVVLQHRAAVLHKIRDYFAEQQVLEVETPLLDDYPVTDPQLENLRVEKPFNKGEWLYLQTSPEYAMKALLAKGSGSIYQVCKAFRKDPVGRLHNIEFTMLEWYRVGFTLHELISDVVALVNAAGINREAEIVSYRQAFLEYIGIDPLGIAVDELQAFAKRRIDIEASSADRDFWLDLLLTHFIEPHLGKGKLTFIVDYPPSQAALAKIKRDEQCSEVAERFELYIDGVEIANGYRELTDVAGYRQRFKQDNSTRLRNDLPAREYDSNFLEAIQGGIPECAGVALGVDRLMLISATC